MTNVNWSQLEKKVAEIKRNTRLGDVSDLSIKQLRKRLKTHLNLDEDNPPLQFDVLQSDVFEAWLLTLEKRDGSTLSFSALKTHRAGLFNLYRDYGCEMSAAMEKDLRQYFKGLKREMAIAFLQQTSKDMLFARAYMVISWNLMCKSANAFGIRHGHMEWSGDALCVYFAHQKNDQEGRRPRDPRHIYVNPLRPAICLVLVLAICWATSSFDGSDRLFPGSK
ncbi:hypothetical protein F444_00562 [Phytophthora nicotianae P1976]|uniref:Uncharacterized protein n=1 Tax=Phytophthora nicotianae P1976 TaxID=1317066 RepID=A0A081B3W7_PHYNI|nr:hypothetical protein F444_00562 [Phytophthora nicotianae P1976]